jgi:FdhD protein
VHVPPPAATCPCGAPGGQGAIRAPSSLRPPMRPDPIGRARIILIAREGGPLVARGLGCVSGAPLVDINPDRRAFSPQAARGPPGNRMQRLRDGAEPPAPLAWEGPAAPSRRRHLPLDPLRAAPHTQEARMFRAGPKTPPSPRRRRPMMPALPILPDPADPRLTRPIEGRDHTGARVTVAVVEERPLTIYLNAQEIVTAMTIGDYPEYLALGFLRNQGMLGPEDEVLAIDHDPEIDTVVVRTRRVTDYEEKMRRKTRTSGCAVGTVFGDMMEGLEGLVLPPAEVRTSWLHALARQINTTPSLYLEAGAIHGTVLCERDRPLVFMEDVGRHNAVDKVAGFMLRHGVEGRDKILYTTGRLTSEMVIKCALMGIPILASRSGFTAWGVEIAREVGLTLIGRMRGARFVCLSGEERLIRDATPLPEEEDRRHRRKGAEDD